jgi:hypothetical protein
MPDRTSQVSIAYRYHAQPALPLLQYTSLELLWLTHAGQRALPCGVCRQTAAAACMQGVENTLAVNRLTAT